MPEPIIRVEQLSKSYTLRHQKAERYVALRDVITNKVRSLFRSDGQPTVTTEEFFALHDVSFDVNPGDRVGIIGRNGAGKSTLLKVLSRITSPTTGRITLNGRVASLLEVGTGFHPELSGRENIYLNGAILGMSRAEINARFDEIVAFAEVEKFLDTPVKRYSSGMYVRLAFAVAAHLEPEILVIDEVLAVGDSAFQKKCLGKMENVASKGRTILFVSHQMDSVQRLCNKGLLLDKGEVRASGSMRQVIDHYLNSSSSAASHFEFQLTEEQRSAVAVASGSVIEDEHGQPVTEVPIGSAWQVRIPFTVARPTEGFVIAMGINTMLDLPLRTTWSEPRRLEAGRYEALFRNDGIHLTDGQYKLVIGLSSQGRVLQYIENQAVLTISAVSALAGDARIVNTRSGLLINQMDVDLLKLD